MSPNSRFWHWNKNLILTAKWRKIYIPSICCANNKGPACWPTSQETKNSHFHMRWSLHAGQADTAETRTTLLRCLRPSTHNLPIQHTSSHIRCYLVCEQHKHWRFLSSGMWHCAGEQTVHDISKTMILRNMGNYLRSDTSIPKERQKATERFWKESV
jgi:hypothetical protein